MIIFSFFNRSIILNFLSKLFLLILFAGLISCGGGSSGGNGNETTITIKTLTVTITGSGTVSSSPSGISCSNSFCSSTFISGTTVNLTATSPNGYSFSGWSGACTGTASTCSVTMSQAQSVTANFSPVTVYYPLSVTITGSGSVSSSPSGISCSSGSCTSSFSNGTTVNLTATVPNGYSFSGWSGACTGASTTCSVSMSQTRSVTATFTPIATSYALSVNVSGSGTVSSVPSGISCTSGSCSTLFNTGTAIVLTATPSSGYTFSGWVGACTTTVNTCSVTMSQAQSVTANFTVVASSYTLSVSNIGTGLGTVTSNTGGISCGTTCSANLASTTSVTLTAVANSGSTFAGWGGACTGTTSTCTLSMSTSRTVTATFNSIASSCTSTGATTLATLVTDSNGNYTSAGSSNPWALPTTSCPNNNGSNVTGQCYGNYAVQPNAYYNLPASTSFSMWSKSASCWGINMDMPTNSSNSYWSAPLVTRGFSFGYSKPLIAGGGNLVSTLNSTYAGSATPCPPGGTSSSVCVKWAMSVPGVASQTSINDSTHTYSNWNALLDIYFHDITNPTNSTYKARFDLQIYQMLMDWQSSGPNWSNWIVGVAWGNKPYTKKTIGGVTYLVAVNMQDPGTYEYGTSNGWVGYTNGTLDMVSMFVLPTIPTGSSSYLWGSPSVTHDVGGIIKWLSTTETRNGVTGIFDDAGVLLKDYQRSGRNVTTPLISPSLYLTGLNAGFEVVNANKTTGGANQHLFTTTDYWVALPGETLGN